MRLETVAFETDAGVGTVTLNRPDKMNCFNETMCKEIQSIWRALREDDSVRVVVIQAAGTRAFSSGLDRHEGLSQLDSPWRKLDPGAYLGPKANDLYKPVISAVHGICAGGAFYFLNESDIVICSDDAMFIDPHVTYGMVSALEPIGFALRAPYGEVMRWALLGLDERLSARRAYEIGLVSEVVSPECLHERAHALALKIAAKPGVATEGTVKAVWQARGLGPPAAAVLGLHYPYLGNDLGMAEAGDLFNSGERPKWELR